MPLWKEVWEKKTEVLFHGALKEEGTEIESEAFCLLRAEILSLWRNNLCSFFSSMGSPPQAGANLTLMEQNGRENKLTSYSKCLQPQSAFASHRIFSIMFLQFHAETSPVLQGTRTSLIHCC